VTGERLEALPLPSAGVVRVTSSGDGTRLAVAVRRGEEGSKPRGGTVTVWDAACRGERATMGGDGGPLAGLSFAPDGRYLVGARKGEVVVWDAVYARPVGVWDAEGGRTAGAVFAAGGESVLVAQERGRLVRWDWRGGGEAVLLHRPGVALHGLALSPDGRVLAVATGRGLELRDAATGKEGQTFRGFAALAAAFAADGKRVACLAARGGAVVGNVGWHVRVYERSAERWQALRAWDLAQPRQGGYSAFALSPDGKRVLTGTWSQREGSGPQDGSPLIASAAVWEVDGRDEGDRPARRVLSLPCAAAASAAFLPGARSLVLGGGGSEQDMGAPGHLSLWDAAAGKKSLALPRQARVVSAVAVSPDGRALATADWSGAVTLWDVADLATGR
jgi:WD40 repeat protein